MLPHHSKADMLAVHASPCLGRTSCHCLGHVHASYIQRTLNRGGLALQAPWTTSTYFRASISFAGSIEQQYNLDQLGCDLRSCHIRCLDMRLALITLLFTGAARAVRVSDERVVFQTSFGDIEFGVYEDVRGLSPCICACRGLLTADSMSSPMMFVV